MIMRQEFSKNDNKEKRNHNLIYRQNMNYEFRMQSDVLIIKLSGFAGPNERLLSKKSFSLSRQSAFNKVIVDMGEIKGIKAIYSIGVLNTMKKEIQLMGGKIKLCSLTPEVEGYFRENRLDRIFDIEPSIEIAQRRFLEENDD
jgi:anti-anti-sigma factor